MKAYYPSRLSLAMYDQDPLAAARAERCATEVCLYAAQRQGQGRCTEGYDLELKRIDDFIKAQIKAQIA